MLCVKCNKEIPEQSVFCNWCGCKQVAEKPARRPRVRGNQTGTVFKRGKTYRLEVTLGKKYNPKTGELVPDRRSKDGFKTRREAYEYVAVLKAQKESESNKPVSSLRDHWKGYSNSQMLKLSNSKQVAYKIAFNKLEPIADRPVNVLTINILQELVDEKAPTYYPARDMKVLLSHLCKRAMAEQDIITNLADFICLPELEEKEPVPFTENELKLLWHDYGAGNKFTGYILLMTYSGMMPGELFKTKKDMIDWENQRMVGCGLKTKKRKETPIVIADLVLPVLKDLCAYSCTDYILDTRRDAFYEAFHATLERAGCEDRTPYVCRHTTATALSLGNIAPEIIKEVMRHTNFSTTERYIHKDVDTSPMLDAVNQLKK